MVDQKRYMTFNLYEVAMNKLLLGIEPDDYNETENPHGKMVVAIYDDKSKVLNRNNMRVVAENKAGEELSAPLLPKGDGNPDLQSVLNYFKRDFFKRIDKDKENQNGENIENENR